MKTKDVWMFREGDEPIVTGSPMEVAKLKADGWSLERPAEPKPAVTPKAVKPSQAPKTPEADASARTETK